MTSSSSLEALQLDIEKVSSRIDRLEEQLVAAECSAAADVISYLRSSVLELPKEKNEQCKKENILLQAQVPCQQGLPVSPSGLSALC